MAEHKHEYPIALMCRVFEISVSGYYAWCKRPESRHHREDAKLAEHVKAVFEQHQGRYGSPRVHAELHDQGMVCGCKRVARLMREQGLVARHARRRTTTTHADPGAHFAPNLLKRDFSASEANTKWVADTTFIWTAQGWLYLAVVLDLYSRMVVGWSMAAVQDATLVCRALQMAIARRRPPAGLLHHSDRGSTYTSESYQTLLREQGVKISVSRTADCYDNAAMESFFHSLKGECIEGAPFPTRAQARCVTFEYLETYFNRTRRHSTLNYMSPFMYEQQEP